MSKKKTDVVKRPKAFNHVGLLSNEPPAAADCSLFSHPNSSIQFFTELINRLIEPRDQQDYSVQVLNCQEIVIFISVLLLILLNRRMVLNNEDRTSGACQMQGDNMAS